MRARAISLRQPWASLIIYGLKPVEIRTWQTNYRGPLIIHAAKTVDEDALLRFRIENPPKGCLIGTVELIEVERLTKPKWHELAAQHLNISPYTSGLYAWHLAEPRQMGEPIPYRGERGLFFVVGCGAERDDKQETLFS